MRGQIYSARTQPAVADISRSGDKEVGREFVMVGNMDHAEYDRIHSDPGLGWQRQVNREFKANLNCVEMLYLKNYNIIKKIKTDG